MGCQRWGSGSYIVHTTQRRVGNASWANGNAVQTTRLADGIADHRDAPPHRTLVRRWCEWRPQRDPQRGRSASCCSCCATRWRRPSRRRRPHCRSCCTRLTWSPWRRRRRLRCNGRYATPPSRASPQRRVRRVSAEKALSRAFHFHHRGSLAASMTVEQRWCEHCRRMNKHCNWAALRASLLTHRPRACLTARRGAAGRRRRRCCARCADAAAGACRRWRRQQHG